MYTDLQKRFARAGLALDVRDLAEALWLTQFDLAGAPSGETAEARETDETPETPSIVLPPTAPPITTDEAAQPEAARLSAGGDASADGLPALEVRLPGASPLPRALALGRALRPLGRRRPSAHALQLDEEATAERAAESVGGRLLTPVFRAAPERWYSVAVVAEEGAAMAVWQPAADELARLFAEHGGFNEVASWRLRFDGGKTPVLVSPASGQTQPLASLQRLGARQLVVLLTDGVSTRWRDGRMARVLGAWGRGGTVVIAQVLGSRRWEQTALGEPQFVVTADAPGQPNRALLARPALPTGHLAFPVVSLSPELVGEWARMVMQPGALYSAVALNVAQTSVCPPVPPAIPPGQTEVRPTPEERLKEFQRLVSDEAYQLAIYLAWMPLALPVMRLAQAAMFAEARPETLAELLLGGIASRRNPDQAISDPNKLRFVFHPGVRQLLQTRIRRDELPPLLRLIGDYISRRTGHRFSFTALLPHPTGDKLLPAGDDLLEEFAEILRDGLMRIGLGHLVAPAPTPPKPSPEDSPPPDPPLPLEHFGFTTVTLKPDGKTDQYRTLTARQFVEPKTPELHLEMVEVRGGKFLMGSPESEKESYPDEKPQHPVEVPSFYIGKFTITQAQWRVVAGWEKFERDLNPDPSYFKDKPDSDQRPVEQISWDDAKEFCARLAQKTGRAYRLPTEAEWEYACRAGTATPFAFGETITPEFVNYNGEYPYGNAKKGKNRGETVPVGSLSAANSFGLFDMHGNVWEWCEDDWMDNYRDAPEDGSARKLSGEDSSRHLLRGGSYVIYARDCRSACRVHYDARGIDLGVGVRVVVSART